MRRARAFLVRLAGLLRRRERELAEEIDSHLDLHVADNIRAGMKPDEAPIAVHKIGCHSRRFSVHQTVAVQSSAMAMRITKRL